MGRAVLLPAEKRRAALEASIAAMFQEDFAGRILPLAGRPISQFDAQIAAIARHRAVALATRNIQDFDHCGLPLVNPWQQIAGRVPR